MSWTRPVRARSAAPGARSAVQAASDAPIAAPNARKRPHRFIALPSSALLAPPGGDDGWETPGDAPGDRVVAIHAVGPAGDDVVDDVTDVDRLGPQRRSSRARRREELEHLDDAGELMRGRENVLLHLARLGG